VADRFGALAALTFDIAEEFFDAGVIAEELAGLIGVPESRIVILLAQREDREIGEAGRFAGRDLGRLGQVLFGGVVGSGLQAGKPDVEGANEVGVLGRGGFGQAFVAAAGGRQSEKEQNGGCSAPVKEIFNFSGISELARLWREWTCCSSHLN